MPGKIPVSALYEHCERMLKERYGYIFGTSGELWTESKQNTTTNDMAQKYGARWIGHHVVDCSGLIVHIWRLFGLKIPHGSSSMVRQGYITDCCPDPHPGWAALVDKTPDTPDNEHIGIVQRDGATVVEAKGTQSGVVTSKATDKKWTKFGKFKDVDYEEADDPMPDGEKVIYRAEVITESGPLNVRSGPGRQYDKIGKLPRGEIVDVMVECPNGWRYIDDDGDQGYVDGRYLKPLPPATSIPETDDKIPAEDKDQPKNAKYTVLRRADGVTITLEGLWTVEE